MKRFLRYLLFLVLVMPMIAYAEEAAISDDDDDGTDENGRVIFSETLAVRCELSSKSPFGEDCIKRLASDSRLGQTPDGNMSYNEEVSKIIDESVGTYMQEAVNRLVEASAHEDKSDKLARKDTASLSAETSGDIRDDLEDINKLNKDNFDLLSSALDVAALRTKSENLDVMLTATAPEYGRTNLTDEEAKDPSLRRDKYGTYDE